MSESGGAAERDSVERFDPQTMSGGLLEAEHKARYWWAARAVGGKKVLDAGCGVGYGARILAAGGARTVVGVDRSDEAIDAARRSSPDGAVEFRVADLSKLPFDDGTFDVAVCFEVIEHIDDRKGVLAELKRILDRDGLLIVSSPNRKVYLPGNPHHVHEYEPEELRKELSAFFEGVDLYRQHSWLGTAVLTDDEFASGEDEREYRLPTHKLEANEPGLETYTIAVAGRDDLPDLESLAALGQPFELREWQEALASTRESLEGLREYAAWLEGRHADAARAASELHRVVRDAHGQLLDRDKKLATALRDVRPLRRELEKAGRYARSLEQRIGELENELRSREQELQAEISKMTNTRVWRVARRYWSARDRARHLRAARRGG
jgi:ubiquinone/menaquinone biosynthesis C-methylase UbiE